MTRRGRWAITALMIALAIVPSLGYARAYMNMFALPGNIDEFTDSLTYLAAGERLNAGHDLYRLQPGDRPVLINPDFFTAPLVSPPLIAVIWRPLAAVPIGLFVWIVACWTALLATMAYLVIRSGLAAVVACLLLAEPIGNQLAVANVTAFFPALLVVAWGLRRTPWAGLIVALMASIKLSPATLFGWRAIHRRPRTLGVALVAMVFLALVALVGAGPGSFLDYIGVATSTKPSQFSLSGVTGIPWLSTAVLLLGTILAMLVRSEAISFQIAVATFVLGNPAFYTAGYVPLLALAAPFERNRVDLLLAELGARAKQLAGRPRNRSS